MTELAHEPYLRWRTFVFAVVVIVAPLVLAGGAIVAATTLQSLDTAPSAARAAGASVDSSDTEGANGTGTGPDEPTSGPSSGPAVADTTAAAPATDIARDSGAAASSTGPDNVDGGNSVTDYRPRNMLDGDMSTAWRSARGKGASVTVTITFHRTATLTEVGLVPGYAKTDPATGVDRFRQEHRITAVNWVFSSGRIVRQDFADEPTMQTVTVDTVANSVRIEVLGVLPADEGYDYTAISEVTMVGSYR